MVEAGKTSLEQAASKIKSLADLHETCERNDFYVPKLSSSAITEKYLLKVLK